MADAEIDDRDVVADEAADDRAQQRIVGAAEQQRVDPGVTGHGEDERLVAGTIAERLRAEERGQRSAQHDLHVRA